MIAFFVPGDDAVIQEGAHFLRIMSLAWGGIGVQLCIVSAFRASGNMLMAMVIAMVSQWMVQFPLAYVLAKHSSLGDQGLWWSFPVTNVVVALVSLAWYAHGGWKTDAHHRGESADRGDCRERLHGRRHPLRRNSSSMSPSFKAATALAGREGVEAPSATIRRHARPRA